MGYDTMEWKTSASKRIRPHLGPLCVVLALFALANCLSTPSPAELKSSGGNPKCKAYCDARKARGCASAFNTCQVACQAAYIVAESQGMCSGQYAAMEDCEYSQAAVDLGCAPPQGKVDSLCRSQSDAWDACVKLRDGK